MGAFVWLCMEDVAHVTNWFFVWKEAFEPWRCGPPVRHSLLQACQLLAKDRLPGAGGRLRCEFACTR